MPASGNPRPADLATEGEQSPSARREVARLAAAVEAAQVAARSEVDACRLAAAVEAVAARSEVDACRLAAVLGRPFDEALGVLRTREAEGHSRQSTIDAAASGWTPEHGWPPHLYLQEIAARSRQLARFDRRRIRCALTDHAYADPPGASEPFCSRCGAAPYWPIRRTLGRYFEDLLSWLRRRLGRD